jgi:hypothetical protein
MCPCWDMGLQLSKPCSHVGEQRYNTTYCWGTRWHCATNRKIAGSVPDVIIAICYRFNPSCRTMALGSIQPVTFMRIGNISCGVKAAGV